MTARISSTSDIQNAPQKAIIYSRVSSKKQTSDGAGLESQEHRCREYAEERGYEVELAFTDDVSGGGDFMNRPGMVALLSFLAAKPDTDFVVIFDDLKRFARDIEFHKKLRRTLDAHGARPECLNFKFEDSPEGEFIETIIAAQGELERKQLRRQVLQKMVARVEQGYWVFHTLPGYKYVKAKGGGKVLVRDEPVASIVQEALEGFASGRFITQSEVQRFLLSRPEFPIQKSYGGIRLQKVTDMLTHPLYAGMVFSKKWNISLRKGKHEALISYEMFERIQKRLKNTGYAPRRSDIGKQFPLRGFVLCADCNTPLTASLAKSCTGRYYPYYLCQKKGCVSYGKSIRRDKLEGEFSDLLKGLRPSAPLYAIAREMFMDAWTQRGAQAKAMQASLTRTVADLDARLEEAMDQAAETDSDFALKALERKAGKLERERLIARERLDQTSTPKAGGQENLELALTFLANPLKLWEKGNHAMRRAVLKMVFADRLQYCRKEGPRTPLLSLPFKALGVLSGPEMQYGAVEKTRLSISGGKH
ncbi:MAG: recombinase family protein [Pseudomonadota bacterium]